MIKRVLMKYLCIALIVSWLSVINGNVIPRDSQLLLKTNGNNIEVYRDNGNEGSWLQMVLVYSRDLTNQSQLLIEDKPCSSPEKTVECKDGFILLDSQICYFFGTQKRSWHDALAVCESMGATLAHPMNAIENTALVNHLKTNYNGTNTYWFFGGSDVDNEGEWVWAHNKAPIVYSDWLKYQPDDYNGIEDCVHYWEAYGWKWNDTLCNLNTTFICQQ